MEILVWTLEPGLYRTVSMAFSRQLALRCVGCPLSQKPFPVPIVYGLEPVTLHLHTNATIRLHFHTYFLTHCLWARWYGRSVRCESWSVTLFWLSIPVPFVGPYSQSYPLQQNITMEGLVLNGKIHELTILTWFNLRRSVRRMYNN